MKSTGKDIGFVCGGGLMRVLGLLVAIFLAVSPAQLAAADYKLDADVSTALANWQLPTPSVNSTIICHGYQCLFRTPIPLTPGDHARLRQFMAAGSASAEAERKAVAQAESWFEKRVAPIAGTAHAKARSGGRFGVGGDPSQFDCIDTTANTTMFLIVLDRLGLLRYHTVVGPISRFWAGGPHFTALIQDKKTGKKYTVDPWPHDNGQLPDVWALDKWLAGG